MRQKNSTKFFFKPTDSMYAYCSHCGHPIAQDHYNMKKHGWKCNFDSDDIYEILNRESYGYDLQKEASDVLVLTIYKPFLVPHAVYQDRYRGGDWSAVFQARFVKNSRYIKEQGLLSFAQWEELIHSKKVRYIGKEPLHQVISSVFPVVPYIYNLRMFFYIYRQKGYSVTDYKAPASVVKKHCTPRKTEFFDTNKKEDEHLRIYGEPLTDQGHSLLAVRVYYTPPLSKNYAYYAFLVGENIFYLSYCTDKNPEFFHNLLCSSARCYIPQNTLTEFSKKCPSFGLQNFLNGKGENILIPLMFSGNFHKALELLAKSGNSWYAEHYFKLDHGLESALFDNEPDVNDYSTVTGLLNLPKALLNTPYAHLFTNEQTRLRLSYIFHTKRSLIEGITYTENVIRFLKNQNVTRDNSITRSQIAGLDRLSDAQIRKILRYLATLPIELYDEYRDYLEMAHFLNIYDFGYCPRNLRLAHDDLSRTMHARKEFQSAESFLLAVNRYRYLETVVPSQTDTKDTPFKDDPFFIRCPLSVSDLQEEGRNQHNCVATYVNWIIRGQSQVLFMREKKNPDTSLITIELQENKLVQAKAPFNKKATKRCQKFILKWCKLNHISYDTCMDITISSAA